MIRTATPKAVAGLADRLTDSQDRDTYAALISYINELPPGDEFRQLMEMLGLLSLVGQRVPAAIAEFLAEVRSQTKAASDYHLQVAARLATLPQEIAAGVDLVTIANTMSEAFRQQLAATGLQETAALLKAATGTMKMLSTEVAATLSPATGEYRAIAFTLSTETAKLIRVANGVEEHNARLMARDRSNRRSLIAAALFIAFLVGGLAGIVLEKKETTNLISNIGAQVGRVETSVLPIVENQVKNKNQGR